MQKTVIYILAGLSLFLLGAFSQWQSQEVMKEDIIAAAKIAGLNITDAEIDSLLPSINEELLPAYADIYAKHIPNSTAPSWGFIPFPTGYVLPTGKDVIQIDLPWDTKLPADENELAFYSVRQLAALLRNGDISSMKLTQFFLNRLKKYDPQLHCVISFTETRALQAAAQADAEFAMGIDRGILHGIPYGAKDLLAVPGYKTTWGAAPYKNQTLDYTATVIKKLDDAGAILVAKLSLGALAWGDVWYEEMTRNPWNTDTGSSGSSAGSASAVAAGLVPFALGTETLGSIVSPATVCGVTGLRPTFGRVSRYGAMALSWTMDKIGPIARSAEDAIAVLQVIDGPDRLDHTVQDAPLHYQSTQTKAFRIGYDKVAFDRSRDQKAADQMVLKILEAQGYELVPIELPKFPSISHILIAEAAAAFDELTRSNQDDKLVRQIKNAWPTVFRQARFIPAVEYIQANRARTHLIQEMAAIFRYIDLYVHPSWASSSLQITNYTGHPCITVPNGFDAEGMPHSITFTGQLYSEGDIVQVARDYQAATKWTEQKPVGF